MTLFPTQIFVFDAFIVTLGLAVLFTVIAKAFELAFVLDAHAFRILILQVTTSPLLNVLEENVVLFVPTLEPLTFH